MSHREKDSQNKSNPDPDERPVCFLRNQLSKFEENNSTYNYINHDAMNYIDDYLTLGQNDSRALTKSSSTTNWLYSHSIITAQSYDYPD